MTRNNKEQGKYHSFSIFYKASERVTAAGSKSVETFMAEHPDAAKIRLVVYPGNEVVELRRNVWGCRTYICWGSCNYCHRQSRDMAMKETISTLLDEIKLLQEN